MATHPDIASSITQYADALGSVVDSAGGLMEFLRSLRDPTVRARRLRRRAARLWRVATRAANRGYSDRAADLRTRAVEAWAEAQRLVPVALAEAIATDRMAA